LVGVTGKTEGCLAAKEPKEAAAQETSLEYPGYCSARIIADLLQLSIKKIKKLRSKSSNRNE